MDLVCHFWSASTELNLLMVRLYLFVLIVSIYHYLRNIGVRLIISGAGEDKSNMYKPCYADNSVYISAHIAITKLSTFANYE